MGSHEFCLSKSCQKDSLWLVWDLQATVGFHGLIWVPEGWGPSICIFISEEKSISILRVDRLVSDWSDRERDVVLTFPPCVPHLSTASVPSHIDFF